MKHTYNQLRRMGFIKQPQLQFRYRFGLFIASDKMETPVGAGTHSNTHPVINRSDLLFCNHMITLLTFAYRPCDGAFPEGMPQPLISCP